MNELIKLTQQTLDNEQVNTVNARELHEFLGVGKDFNTWIKNRLDSTGAEENKDYLVFPQIGEKGGRPRIEFYISLDTAKHVSMMEKTPAGRQIRDYFIQCEKQLQHGLKPKDQCYLDILHAGDEVDRLLALRKLEQTVVKPLEESVERMKPKEQFYDTVTQSEAQVDITQAAKLLNYVKMGRNNLYKYLREKGILNHKNIPYQQYLDRGYFKLVETSWVNPRTQETEIAVKPVLFQKGLDWLDKKLTEEGYQKK